MPRANQILPLEVCPLCGVGRSGGPRYFVTDSNMNDLTYGLAYEMAGCVMYDSPETLPPRHWARICEIAKEALSTTLPAYVHPTWLPDGVGCESRETLRDPRHYTTWRWVAVGYFQNGEDNVDHDEENEDDTSGLPGYAPVRDGLLAGDIPDGKNVQVRMVSGNNLDDESMVFDKVFITPPAGTQERTKRAYVQSMCWVLWAVNPNFAMCERCYHYLKY